ncbi:hypothetical protein BKA64DRAFT_438716 [Cadophora sp. MPI-SDFR-AT-0126]|nr:hypothetical protein BKA64DRAFT_438716 [Leotiomycetes sp. MPI-SDFR-AT-0126]
MSFSELHGRALPGPLRTVEDMLVDSAHKYRSRTAVVCLHQPADLYASVRQTRCSELDTQYLRWTFEELSNASHAMVCALVGSGIRPGMTIAAVTTNGIEFHIAFRAALELRCTFASVNPKMTGNIHEIIHVLDVLQAAVLIAPDASAAQSLESAVVAVESQPTIKLAYGDGATPEHWQNFGSFIESGDTENETIPYLRIDRKLDDVVLILFTSGTTSLPKGVPHTNETVGCAMQAISAMLELDSTSSSCNHAAAFHVFGIYFSLVFHMQGLKVVHPSAAYDAGSTLAALQSEKSSHFPGVPAMVDALVSHPEFSSDITKCLQNIILGGTTITPEHMRVCTDVLRCTKVSNTYGMTEITSLWIHPPNTELGRNFPAPGAMLRVCDPESGTVVPRGHRGELHVGGPQVVNNYCITSQKNHEVNSVFYDDTHGHWIKTGDQAIMAENGEVTIVGRYKDLIIRGGENISPSAIESFIASRFGISAEVVGIHDDISSEVPVAVIKKSADQSIDVKKIQEAVLPELGSSFAPETIIDIKDLNLSDYPRTASGKVQKYLLRDKVIQQQQRQTYAGSGTNENDMTTLTKVWANVLGISERTITPETSVHDWADSLMLVRFSAVFQRACGKLLSLQDLLENPTIQAQAKILSSRNVVSRTAFSDMWQDRIGPPSKDDMIHANGDSERARRTQEICTQTLSPLGFAWSDVEDVIPMHGAMRRFLTRRRNQSSNHRHVWLCPGKSISNVVAALETALSHHAILRSMAIYFDESTPLHLVMRPSQTLFSKIITRVTSVPDATSLRQLVYNDPASDYAAFPGPMIRIFVTFVEERNCAGIVYLIQHSVFDSISLSLFLEDLDIALQGPRVKLEHHIPYRAWAESYFNLEKSISAQNSIAWHLSRLAGLSAQSESLFPTQRAPEWFKGNSAGWTDPSTGKLGMERKPLDNDPVGVLGITKSVVLRDVQKLKMDHGIEVPQLVKTALALVNVRHTKTDTALFGQYQAARVWPFLSDWQAVRMPNAMDVNGPTVQTVVVNASVKDDQTIIKMMNRLQREQSGLNKHSAAPYYSVIEKLNTDGCSDGSMMEEVLRRQIFNWLPGGLAGNLKNLESIQKIGRPDLGLLWNCSMSGQQTLDVHVIWDDAQLRVGGGKLARRIVRVVRSFIKRGNLVESYQDFYYEVCLGKSKVYYKS